MLHHRTTDLSERAFAVAIREGEKVFRENAWRAFDPRYASPYELEAKTISAVYQETLRELVAESAQAL